MSNRVRPRPATENRPRRAQTAPPRRHWTAKLSDGRQRRVALAAAGLFVVAAAATWLLWPDDELRQREYLDATACLLTDERGVTSDEARPVWTAMQDASVASLVKVQYLAVGGPQTSDNARAHVASLAGSRCGVVIGVGEAQIDAISAAAPGFPQVRFVTVGGEATAANVSTIDDGSADGLRTALIDHVTALADADS